MRPISLESFVTNEQPLPVPTHMTAGAVWLSGPQKPSSVCPGARNLESSRDGLGDKVTRAFEPLNSRYFPEVSLLFAWFTAHGLDHWPFRGWPLSSIFLSQAYMKFTFSLVVINCRNLGLVGFLPIQFCKAI